MYWDKVDERIKGFAYAAEPKRLLSVATNEAILKGEHERHILLRTNGTWACDCSVYQTHSVLSEGGWCRHTIATERILTATSPS